MHNTRLRKRYQFNYYINTICNLTCNYCYARAGMKWNTIIPFTTIERELQLLKDNKSIISLIGGEPTIHPQFFKILDLIKDWDNDKHIYTNGVSWYFDNMLDKDIKLIKHFKWTFSYHKKHTINFIKNLLFIKSNNGIVELTVPAQNMTKELYDFIQENRIDTLISFIHEVSSDIKIKQIDQWVLDINEPHIKNMSKFANEKVSYTNMLCEYSEVDIVNGRMISNDCNHNIDLKMNKLNVKSLFTLPQQICNKEYCKQDCAFLLPKKETL